MQDLVAGQIDLIVDQASNSLPQVQAGTIRAYAVTDTKRLAAAPDIPTVDEAGLPGFHVSLWSALWVPKGTPKDVIAKLNAAVKEALADPAVQEAARRRRRRHSAACAADTGGAARLAESRSRQVVADDQGGERQAGVRVRAWDATGLLALRCCSPSPVAHRRRGLSERGRSR